MKSTFFSDFWEPIRTFLKAPFEELPPQYGDPVPPDLRMFEAEVEEAQHHPREMGAGIQPHHSASRPAGSGSGGNKPGVGVLQAGWFL